MSQDHVDWPDLPTNGFIVGRVATVKDAQQGNAIFSFDGTGGDSVSMTIPQYAYWSDEHGSKHPMILVQAERTADGSTTAVGLRDFAGGETVATLPEIELLGTKKPN